MTPFVLDTNIIVDVLRWRNDRHLLQDHLLDQGQPLSFVPHHADAVREARPDALVPGCQHRSGVHRIQLHADHQERQGLPHAGTADLSVPRNET
jgi:hypothetical protein